MPKPILQCYPRLVPLCQIWCNILAVSLNLILFKLNIVSGAKSKYLKGSVHRENVGVIIPNILVVSLLDILFSECHSDPSYHNIRIC